jgi:hypothetical protein
LSGLNSQSVPESVSQNAKIEGKRKRKMKMKMKGNLIVSKYSIIKIPVREGGNKKVTGNGNGISSSSSYYSRGKYLSAIKLRSFCK